MDTGQNALTEARQMIPEKQFGCRRRNEKRYRERFGAIEKTYVGKGRKTG